VSRASEMAASLLEHEAGARCGACGGTHVSSPAELERLKSRSCLCCPRCLVAFGERFARLHPDLVASRHGRRVITSEALAEATRRLEAETAELLQE